MVPKQVAEEEATSAGEDSSKSDANMETSGKDLSKVDSSSATPPQTEQPPSSSSAKVTQRKKSVSTELPRGSALKEVAKMLFWDVGIDEDDGEDTVNGKEITCSKCLSKCVEAMSVLWCNDCGKPVHTDCISGDCKTCPACGTASLSSVQDVGENPAKPTVSEPLAAAAAQSQASSSVDKTNTSPPHPRKGAPTPSGNKKRSTSSQRALSPDITRGPCIASVQSGQTTKAESPEEFFSFSETEEHSDSSESRTSKSKGSKMSATSEDNENTVLVSATPINQSNVIEESSDAVATEEQPSVMLFSTSSPEHSVKIPRSDESLPIGKQSTNSSSSSSSPPPSSSSSKMEKSKLISQRSFSTGDISAAVMSKREDTTDGGESDANQSSPKRQTKGPVDASTPFFTPSGRKRACTIKKEEGKSESNQNTDNEKSESSGPGSYDASASSSPSGKKKPASVKSRKAVSAPATISEDNAPIPTIISVTPSTAIKPPKVRLSAGSSTASNISSPSRKKSIKSSMESLVETTTEKTTPKLKKQKEVAEQQPSTAQTVVKTLKSRSRSPAKKSEVSPEVATPKQSTSTAATTPATPASSTPELETHKRKGRRPKKSVKLDQQQQRTITDVFANETPGVKKEPSATPTVVEKPKELPGRPKKRKLSEAALVIAEAPEHHSSAEDGTDNPPASVMEDVLAAVISPPKKRNKIMQTAPALPVTDVVAQVSTEGGKRTTVEATPHKTAAEDSEQGSSTPSSLAKKKGKAGKKSVIEMLKTTKEEDSAAEADDEAEFEEEVVRQSVKKIKTKRLSDASATPSPKKVSAPCPSPVPEPVPQISTLAPSNTELKSPKASSPKRLKTVESLTTVAPTTVLPVVPQTPDKKLKKKNKDKVASTPTPSAPVTDPAPKGQGTPKTKEKEVVPAPAPAERTTDKKTPLKRKKAPGTSATAAAPAESLPDNFDVESDSSANSKSSLTLDCDKVAMTAKVGRQAPAPIRQSLSPEKKVVKSPSLPPTQQPKLPKTSTTISTSPAQSSPPAAAVATPASTIEPSATATPTPIEKLNKGLLVSGKRGSPPAMRPKRTSTVVSSTPTPTPAPVEPKVEDPMQVTPTTTGKSTLNKKSKLSVLAKPGAAAAVAAAAASAEKLSKRAKSLSSGTTPRVAATEATTPSVKTTVKSKQLVLSSASVPEAGGRGKTAIDRDPTKVKKFNEELIKTSRVASPAPSVENTPVVSASTEKLKKGEKVLQPKAKNTATPVVTNSRSEDESSEIETGVSDNNVQKSRVFAGVALSEDVLETDLELFKQAQTKATSAVLPRSPRCIAFGKYEIQTLYNSPYPQEYAKLNKLFLCEFCLKYVESSMILERHLTKCRQRYPPGTEIYRKEDISVFEVDGNANKMYCQNLFYLAKFFLHEKYVDYFMDCRMNLYVITKNDSLGSHLMGYFSKEQIRRLSNANVNLSCIMILPQYQGQGYGRFLIDFSYLLSKTEGELGTPEKPLSDLGRVSYHSYWKSCVLEYLHQLGIVPTITIDQISQATGMSGQDVATALQLLNFVKRIPDPNSVRGFKLAICVDWKLVEAHAERVASSKTRIFLDPDALRWTPTPPVQAEVWCLCRKEEYGDMIECENEKCPYKWYHMPCVGISTVPKGKWICPQCLLRVEED